MGEFNVKRRDALPVRFLRYKCTRVTSGDRSLKGVGARRASQFLSAFERGEATSNKELIPQRTLLIQDHDRLSRCAYAGSGARDLNLHQSDDPMDLGVLRNELSQNSAET